jgi:hypothetical protein
MRRKIRSLVLAAVAAVALVGLLPAPAQAQHRGGVHVYVGGGYWGGYPYWGWGPYWGMGWGPYWGWGGWYGYPYYGYRAHPDNSAKIKLEVTPKDAQVYMDGYYMGVVDDFDGTFQRLNIQSGDHEMVLFKEGFRTVKQTVRLRPGQDSKIRYAMEKLRPGETAEAPPPPPPQEQQEQQPPQETRRPARPNAGYGTPPPGQDRPSRAIESSGFGSLVVRVQPAGAEILIDGERWQGPEGQDRLVIQVADGRHRVEVRKDGFVTFTTEITVRGGETTPLNVSLPPRGER